MATSASAMELLEARSYYSGLISQPKLLARTGRTPWPPAPPPFSPEERQTYGDTIVPPPWTAETVKKSLGPIDGPFYEGEGHPLITAWPHIRDLLVAAVGSSALKDVQTLIFATKITTNWVTRRHHRRHSDCKTSAVTVLLGISVSGLQQVLSTLKTTTSEAAIEAVEACKNVLVNAGFADIEVEAYTTEIYGLSGLSEPDEMDLERIASGSSSAEVKDTIQHHDLEKNTDVTASRTFSSLLQRKQVSDQIVSTPMSFLHYPGQMIERTLPVHRKPTSPETPKIRSKCQEHYQQTGATGSLCLYIALGLEPQESTGNKLKTRADNVFALTSRHVAMDPDMDPRARYRYEADTGDSKDNKENNTPPHEIKVLWGQRQSLIDAATNLNEIGADIISAAELELRHIEELAEEEASLVDDAFAFVSTNIKRLSEAMLSAATSSYGGSDVNDEDNNDDSQSRLETRKRREIGHVIASSPLGTTDKHVWSDWALIELNAPAKNYVLGRPRHTANTIFVGPSRGVRLIDYILNYRPGLKDIAWKLFDRDGFLWIRGTRFPGTLDSHRQDPPATEPTDFQDKGKGKAIDKGEGEDTAVTPRSEFVIKRGARTGVTLGLTNEIEAVVRMPSKKSDCSLAYHLLVYPTSTGSRADLPSDRLVEMFSAPGDSGSAIVGLDGSVIAMIDAGAGSSSLGRIYQRPPASLPTAQDQGQARVDEIAAVALASAKNNAPPPPGYLPTTTSAIHGQGNLNELDMDVTLATPIDWVLENVSTTLGQPVRLL